MKPTVRSIAALASVSRGTVSRVLNNQPDVSAEVRARVLRIIEETGYRKDTRFQGAEKIHIGVIVAHWQNEYFTNSTLRGIHLAERELNTARIQLDVRLGRGIYSCLRRTIGEWRARLGAQCAR